MEEANKDWIMFRGMVKVGTG